jgi:hypothetical protein
MYDFKFELNTLIRLEIQINETFTKAEPAFVSYTNILMQFTKTCINYVFLSLLTEAIFLIKLGTILFPAGSEVHMKTTRNLVPSCEQARIQHMAKNKVSSN